MLLLKVCGMRNVENINNLIQLNPNFIGLIFHEKSSRNVNEYVSINVPKSIQTIGVFVDESEDFILKKVTMYNLNMVQLHGKESPVFCKKLKESNQKVMKAFNIHPEFDFFQLKAYEPFCDYFLFDAHGKNAGGNGITFDWELLKSYQGKTPFLLSGGINNSMIQDLKHIDHPMFKGIDINSQFEIEPALKNIKKIKKFKNELQR